MFHLCERIVGLKIVSGCVAYQCSSMHQDVWLISVTMDRVLL